MTLFKSVGASGGIARGLQAQISTETNTRMTFQCPTGTYYAVPAGKIFKITKILYVARLADCDVGVSYGDNAVAEGITAPTNEKHVIGLGTSKYYQLIRPTNANVLYSLDIYAEIPEGKYPCLVKLNTGANANTTAFLIGVED